MLQLSLGFEVSLHVGDVGMIAAVALQLVQDLEKDPEDAGLDPLPWSALLSMLKRMTSVLAATARLMSPKSMASLTLLSKNSTACLL